MFDHQHDPTSAPRDEAERLDLGLEDIDWTVLPGGALASTFSAPSGPLATFSLGDPHAERVVLAPGVSGSKEDFTVLAPVLAAAGYRVESYDLAGQYQSASAGPSLARTGASGHYDYPLFRDDLIALLESGAPAHLLGYSFAGTVTQLVTVERPELVLSLTLLATTPEPGNGFRGVRGLGPFTGLVTGRVGAALMTWGIVTNKNHVPPNRLAFVRHRFEYTSRRSMEDIIRLMKHAPDLREQLHAVPIPKLVAVGSHDLWPLALHREFAERIGATLAVYETGHSPCETAPHQLARDMVALFGQAADSTGRKPAGEAG